MRLSLPLLALTLAAACGTEDDSPATTPTPVGSDWTVRPTGTLSDLEAVAYGGAFVAVGRGGVILRSEDGTTWRAVDSTTSNDLSAVTYAASRYVAVGTAGTILLSPTGEFWTRADAGTDEPFDGVTYAGTTYLVLGSTHILDTYDTKMWYAHTLRTPLYGTAMVSYDGSSVALVGENKLYTSPSGFSFNVDWTEHALPDPMFAPRALAAADGQALFLLGTKGTAGSFVYRSGPTWKDPWTWTGGQASASELHGIAVRKAVMVAVGDGGTVVTATALGDGAWTPRASHTHENLNAIATDGHILVAVGNRGVVISE
jgi:hypothetical protein